MINVTSTYPPVLYRNPITGQTQLAGGTIKRLEVDGDVIDPRTPIPEGLDLGWFGWVTPPSPAPVTREVHKVKGSSGKMYLVERHPNGKWSCTCPGYQYRRFCKHTEGRR